MASRAQRVFLGFLLGTPVVAAIAIGVVIASYPRRTCACETPEEVTSGDLYLIVEYPGKLCAGAPAAAHAEQLDYWKTPVKIACTSDGGIVAISAGPDKIFDTRDDIQRHRVGAAR